MRVLCKVCDVVSAYFKHKTNTNNQGRSQRGATGANAPARLSGAPKTFARPCGVAVANFLRIYTRPLTDNLVPAAPNGSGASHQEAMGSFSDLRVLVPPKNGVP